MAKYTYMKTPDGMVFKTEHPEYHESSERLSQQKGMDARREYCIKELRKMIKPGQKVYCILRSVSNSGMSRVISLYIIHKGELRNIDSLASDVLLYSEGPNGGIKIGGCGMDMGFAMVYNLSRYLFRNGFGIEGEQAADYKHPKVIKRPKTEKHAKQMVSDGFKFRGRNGDSTGWDNDGGYALKHEWM